MDPPLTRVSELLPGDLVSQGGMQAVFITHCPHPVWPRLRLVIWRLDDGGWSHDALDADQDVGEAAPATSEERQHRLRAVLGGGPDRWRDVFT